MKKPARAGLRTTGTMAMRSVLDMYVCMCIYIYIYIYIQGVSRLVDITAGGDFLGLWIKKVHINMCPILDVYGVMTA